MYLFHFIHTIQFYFVFAKVILYSYCTSVTKRNPQQLPVFINDPLNFSQYCTHAALSQRDTLSLFPLLHYLQPVYIFLLAAKYKKVSSCFCNHPYIF